MGGLHASFNITTAVIKKAEQLIATKDSTQIDFCGTVAQYSDVTLMNLSDINVVLSSVWPMQRNGDRIDTDQLCKSVKYTHSIGSFDSWCLEG